MAKPNLKCRSYGAVALLGLLGGLGVTVSACAVLYPERSTPLRGVVSEDHYQPPPPKDVLYVGIKSARIPPKTRDGRSWDQMGGSAPDAYAILFVDNQEILRTVVIPNSLRPEWPTNATYNLRIPESAKVRLEVWDDNALVSHPICNHAIRDIQDAAGLGELELDCDSGASVTLIVQAPKARMGIGLYYESRGKDVFISRVIAASAAGRAGLVAGDRVISIGGRPVQQLAQGDIEEIFSAESSQGIGLELRGNDGEPKHVKLQDEPMYPTKGEGVELVAD